MDIQLPAVVEHALHIFVTSGTRLQAAVFKCVGVPLVIETRPDPVPESDEVVIRVARCGICGTDLSMTDGSGQIYPLDSVIGHEFAGEVVATGTHVTGLKVGDRITALPYAGCGRCATCLAGRPNFCAELRGVPGGVRSISGDP